MLGTVRSKLLEIIHVPEGEADAGFQVVLENQIRRGMVVTASLGLVAVAVFIGLHLITGSRPIWMHTGGEGAAVSLADKAFVVAVCVVLLAAARRDGVRRWGRTLLGVVMVASGLAMALDDVARADFTFTVAWLVLVQLVAVGTVPFTPRHALAISLAMLGVYFFALSLRPDGIPEDLYEHRLAYFLFATVIVVTLSRYLYRARYGQHRALVDAEDLRDALADRTGELERSLSELGEAQDQLVRQERLAALGQITTGVAHEIQNPLNFVTNFAALTQDLTADLRTALADGRGGVEEILEDLDQNVTSIHEHGRRAAQIVNRMMEHARGGGGRLMEVDLNALVEQCVCEAERRLGSRLGGAGSTVEIRQKYRPELARARVDPREMGAVLMNLLDNAFRAALDGGHGTPTVFVETEAVPEGIEIRVADNGPGIPEALHDRLFEPFFTTRSPGEGTGLGLSLAYEAVTHGHRGTLVAEPRSGGGAVFVIRLPTPPSPPAP